MTRGVIDILNPSTSINFIKNHWAGNLSLYFSFWVNFILITLTYNGIESLVRSNFWQFTVSLPILVAYLALSRLVVFPWQIVGLLRSCEKHFVHHGQTLKIRTIQGLVIVVIMMNAVGVIDSMQWYLSRQNQALEKASISKTKNYSLTLQKNSTLIYLDGSFDFGITGDMETILTSNPGIHGIVLSSSGGYVSEGRGIFRLIDQYKLDTFVYKECSSACALAFIAGNNRSMAANARLGFHQYNFELQTAFQPVDIVEAQKEDLKLLSKKHISSHFLEQVFKQPSHLIWFPSAKELLDSGVVNTLIDAQNGSNGPDQ